MSNSMILVTSFTREGRVAKFLEVPKADADAKLKELKRDWPDVKLLNRPRKGGTADGHHWRLDAGKLIYDPIKDTAPAAQDPISQRIQDLEDRILILERQLPKG